MCKFALVIACFLCSVSLFAQNITSCLEKSNLSQSKEKNEVFLCNEDENQSTFIISVVKPILLHYHEFHTENIFVLEGKAKMRLGEDTILLKKGMHLTIPKGTPHAVLGVMGKKNLLVVSVQSPRFDGKDRVFPTFRNK